MARSKGHHSLHPLRDRRATGLIKATSMQANIMLSYPVSEACDLLDSKLQGATGKMADCEEDLDFLREQITVSCGFLASHWSGKWGRGLRAVEEALWKGYIQGVRSKESGRSPKKHGRSQELAVAGASD